MSWKIYHRYEIQTDSFALYARYDDRNGARYLIKPFEIEKIEPGKAYTGAPTMGIRPGEWGDGTPLCEVGGFLQAALDAAWEIGLRPKGYEGGTQEIAAIRYHLEDMRKLAKVK